MKDKRIGVVMGGPSAEREVSLRTGAAVRDALEKGGYTAIAIDWTGGESVATLLRDARIDVVWIALHGTLGEDGCIQGLLECERIPYTGSGVLASALGMDKIASKKVFDSLHVATPAWTVYRSETDGERFDFPFVIKPSRQGSSVGLSLVRRSSELAVALEAAGRFTGDILLEEYVPGRELSVGVLDNEVLGIVEIHPAGDLYDCNAKYDYKNNHTEYILPAP